MSVQWIADADPTDSQRRGNKIRRNLKNSKMLSKEIIQKIVDCGILNQADMESMVRQEMDRRERLLKEHPHEIWRSKDGKYWYTYINDPSKPSGRRLIKKTSRQAIEDHICNGKAEKHHPRSFKEVYDAWRATHDTSICNNSIRRYETDYRRFIEGSDFEKCLADTLTKSDVEAFILQRIRELKLCRSAAKKLYECLHDVFLFALEKDWIAKDPMQFVKNSQFGSRCYISERAKKPQTISPEDAAKILEQTKKDHERRPGYIPSYAVDFAMTSAMRVAEIAALRWSDIDFDKQVIRVRFSEKYDRKTRKYYIDDTKNHAERTVPLTDQIRCLLFIVKQRVGDSEFVFGGIHANVISSCIRNKCKQAGVPYHGIHACRKTINSNMKHCGASGMMTSSILGNTEEVNAKYYSFDTSDIDEKRTMLERASMIRETKIAK